MEPSALTSRFAHLTAYDCNEWEGYSCLIQTRVRETAVAAAVAEHISLEVDIDFSFLIVPIVLGTCHLVSNVELMLYLLSNRLG